MKSRWNDRNIRRVRGGVHKQSSLRECLENVNIPYAQ